MDRRFIEYEKIKFVFFRHALTLRTPLMSPSLSIVF